jgi:hypothetical protein
MDDPNDLLLKARETSEVWLRAWGCQIRHLDFCTLIRHSESPDYNAIYDIASPSAVAAALRLAAEVASDMGSQPTLFIPNSPEFAAAHQRLAALGCSAAARSETIAVSVELPSVASEPNFRLKPVVAAALDRWIDFYETNSAHAPGSDRHRWTQVFESEPGVQFLLIEPGGEACGTAQITDVGNGCCGVYSVSMPVRLRGLRFLKRLRNVLTSYARARNCAWLTFDRLRPLSRVKRIASGESAGSSRQILSSETGYVLSAGSTSGGIRSRAVANRYR